MPSHDTPVTLVIGLSLAAALALQDAHAAAFRLLLETDADTDNNEVFITSFATFDDLVNSPPSGGTGAFSGINVNPAYSAVALPTSSTPSSPRPACPSRPRPLCWSSARACWRSARCCAAGRR